MDDVRQNQNAQAAKEYAAAWFQKMVEIWGDKMRLLDIHDTGTLQQSIANRDLALSDANMKMSFEFMAYGIYVDAGVGNGYKRGNGGNLDILNPIYRQEHGLDKPRRRGKKAGKKMTSGKPRERRLWFSRSWFISVEVFKTKLAEIYAENFVGLFDNL